MSQPPPSNDPATPNTPAADKPVPAAQPDAAMPQAPTSDMPAPKRSGMLRSTAVFTSMTFLSRIAGYLRDWLQATMFGAGPAVSAFVVAYRIPNYLRRIFAEGSFSSAFVPVLTELREKGDKKALQDFMDHIAGALLAAVVIVSAIGMLAAPWIARVFLLFAPADAETVPMAADMLRITFPYLTFISMTALAGAALNSFRHFGLPALTPVLHNLAMIGAMLLISGLVTPPEKSLAWGVLAAGILQMLVLWPALGKLGIRPRFKFNLRHEGVRRVFKLMLPTIFSSSVAQVNVLVGTIFASLLVPAAQSWLYYSDRLTELPLGLFGVAIGTVILPQLSRHHAKSDEAGYSKSLDWGLRMVLLLGLPAAVGLIMLSTPLTISLFRYGQFTAEDGRMVGYALSAMCIGVPAFMLTKVLLSAFYSRKDTKTPMRAAVWTVVCNVVLIVALVTPMWRMGLPWAHTGIAAATAIAGIFNAILLWRWLRRDGIYQPEPGWARWWLKLTLGVLVMAAVVWFGREWVGDFTRMGAAHRWGWLLALVAAGGVAYGVTLLALGVRPRHLRG
ncbi:MAG: murein biosynthesis integral membrane protein MurJ [Pseudomonadota bacterium]|nr:murein biosynthesis integral membrane protein MurJ [Pseudomonadota bacterium]